jgi:5-methylcytosine-specific restriction endonuclease McrA
MALSKLEIQQMLREMNVKFHADETYDQLKQRLQQENHSLWLKSVSAKPAVSREAGRPLVRKRKKGGMAGPSAADADPTVKDVQTVKKAAPPRHPRPLHSAADPGGRNAPRRWDRTIDKPAPGKPWKAAADGTEPFNRKKRVFESVLKRAGRCCEQCGADTAAADLAPYHILPVEAGGEHSVKNVVALCPACLASVTDDPNPKILKELKRKTRARLYESLQVVRKKRGRRWKRDSRRRR